MIHAELPVYLAQAASVDRDAGNLLADAVQAVQHLHGDAGGLKRLELQGHRVGVVERALSQH